MSMIFEHPRISTLQSATFAEFVLLPRFTDHDHHLSEVSLRARLSDDLTLGVPFMSAAMESVTGAELAVALAQHGGLGVLPAGNVSAEEQLEAVRRVKSFRGGLREEPLTTGPKTAIAALLEDPRFFAQSLVPVLDDQGRLLGGLSKRTVNPAEDGSLEAHARMLPRPALPAVKVGSTPEQALETGLAGGLGAVLEVDAENRFLALLELESSLRERALGSSVRDRQGRLAVGVAVSTHPEDLDRARSCVQAGADLVSVDASDGFSVYMGDTVKELKKLGVPLVAGNIVEAEGFRFLAELGVDAVKVGIGSGSICTTRRVKAIGRGQATAVLEVARARDEYARQSGRYLPIISDGGLQGTGDMSVALALGADCLMMGRYFAGFAESPTEPYLKRVVVPALGQETLEVPVKPYWGEASKRAKNVRRYQQNDPRTFVIEGEEGYVLLKGSLHDGLPRDLKAICGTLSSCGCSDLEQFRSRVHLEFQSLGSQAEGGTSILRA